MSYKVKKANEDYAVLTSGQEAHWEVVERILFIYAKLNPGQSYVQGMNEIIGPIYYLFATDPDGEWRGNSLIKSVILMHLFFICNDLKKLRYGFRNICFVFFFVVERFIDFRFI